MARPGKMKEELKRLEDERQRIADNVASCMRLTAIGQLAAGVAHELNNPLSVILGYAQSLRHQYSGDQTLQDPLNNMEREALRCKRLVQDLLSFSRLPRPGKVMEDVTQVLEGALSLVEAQSRIRHVDLIRDYSENLPMLSLDRHRIQQLMINLCTNALDAMPKGGQLTISVRIVAVSKEVSGVEIRVKDTGVGISPEIRDRIFEPFFTTKELGKGTGLGLSLVREVVREHDAHMDVTSELGQGTTFSIRLPFRARSVSSRRDGNNIEGPASSKVR